MQRPTMIDYESPAEYLRDMIRFLKGNRRGFSVLKACSDLRRVSPTLVTLMVQGKRKITLDRADDLARLLKLTPREKQIFRDWVERLETPDAVDPALQEQPPRFRRRATLNQGFLDDWVNVYVKDAFQLEETQKDPTKIYRILSGIASQKRLEKSVKYLKSTGHLVEQGGCLVPSSELAISDEKVPNESVRKFHKASLRIAGDAIDQYPMDRRLANALVVPLDEAAHIELRELIDDFAEQLQSFAEKRRSHKGQLYQLLINLSPTGGKP